jgi:hypothetical protein
MGQHEKITRRLSLFEQDLAFAQIDDARMTENNVNLSLIQVGKQQASLNEWQYLGVID